MAADSFFSSNLVTRLGSYKKLLSCFLLPSVNLLRTCSVSPSAKDQSSWPPGHLFFSSSTKDLSSWVCLVLYLFPSFGIINVLTQLPCSFLKAWCPFVSGSGLCSRRWTMFTGDDSDCSFAGLGSSCWTLQVSERFLPLAWGCSDVDESRVATNAGCLE